MAVTQIMATFETHVACQRTQVSKNFENYSRVKKHPQIFVIHIFSSLEGGGVFIWQLKTKLDLFGKSFHEQIG